MARYHKINFVQEERPYPYGKSDLVKVFTKLKQQQRALIECKDCDGLDALDDDIIKYVSCSKFLEEGIGVRLFTEKNMGKKSIVTIATRWPPTPSYLSICAGKEGIKINNKFKSIRDYELYIFNCGAYETDLRTCCGGIIFDSMPAGNIHITLTPNVGLRINNSKIIRANEKLEPTDMIDYFKGFSTNSILDPLPPAWWPILKFVEDNGQKPLSIQKGLEERIRQIMKKSWYFK